MSLGKNLWMMVSIEGVRDEQPTEEQNFCYEEQPNTQLARVELLSRAIKVMAMNSPWS